MITSARCTVATGALLLTALGTAPLLAQSGEVRSLGDHFTGSRGPADSYPIEFAALGPLTLFSAVDGEHGRELWVTDGTPQGTHLVKDIYPGPASSAPEDLVTFDGLVYFSATDNSYNEELWSSDGTPEGTSLVADLWPGANEDSQPRELTVAGDNLFFTATTGEEGRELWRVPAGGTPELVIDLRTGPDSSSPRDLLAFGNVVAFSYYTPETGIELGISNGTAAGTSRFDIEPGPTGSAPKPLHGQALRLLFSAETSDVGRELRKYNSITDDICLVVDAYPGSTDSDPREVVTVGTDVYFTADRPSGPGKHFLRSSVSCVGLLTSLHNEDSAGLTVHDGLVVFESEGDLWITDGTGPGTTASEIATPGISAYFDGRKNVWFVPWDGRLWFRGAGGIWWTDGTSAGTQLVHGCNGCPNNIEWFEAGADGVYASINDEFVGREPYRGTSFSSMTLVKDIHQDVGNSVPTEFTTLGGRVYFPAYTDDEGRELLTWDGGLDAATLVEDLYPGASDADPQRLLTAGDKLYYVARSPGTGSELRRLEDPGVGSDSVMQISGGGPFAELGDQLLFVAQDDDFVEQLWSTTGVGATQISSFPDGSSTGVVQWIRPVVAGSQVYYFADDGIHGDEVWMTDGATTDLVIDLLPGPDTGPNGYRASHGGRLFFGANDGTQDGLWSTDGTVQNTQLVTSQLSLPAFSVGSVLVYLAYDEATGYEWWVTDGTPGSESLLAEINPGPSHGIYVYGLNEWAVSGDRAFFQANSATTGVELWVTDGTPAGTHLVRDIAPGPQSSEPQFITPLLGGGVVFTAWSPDAGFELWRSNGTSAGTYRVTDLAPGPESSFPSSLAVLGDWVLFSAWSGTAGREPWAYDSFNEPVIFIDGFESGDTSAW